MSWAGAVPIVIRAVELDQPRLSLIALEDGTANWDISRQDCQWPDARRAVEGNGCEPPSLRDQERGSSVRQPRAKLKATLAGYNQSLSGDFSQNRSTVQTRLSADTASVAFAGIPYLNRVKLGLTADAAGRPGPEVVHASRRPSSSLNDLKLGVSGSAKSTGKLLGLDLAFKAPSTNFRSILSLVPAVYAHDFDKVRTSGSFSMGGRVKGEYGDSAFPAFALNAKVNDAAFQYPDLPLPARSHLHGSGTHQSRRQRRQHRGQARALPHAARPESGRCERWCSGRRCPIPTWISG